MTPQQFQPTAEQRIEVEHLVAFNFTEDDLAVVLELPVATIRAVYSEEIAHGRERTLQRFRDKLANTPRPKRGRPRKHPAKDHP